MVPDGSSPSPVVLVGRSSAARALSAALERAGEEVRTLPGSPPFGEAERAELGRARTVVLACPDRHLAPLAERTARALGLSGGRPVVLHLSGALDSTVLSPLSRLGCPVGSCHPLQTFPRGAAPPLEGVAFAVEGDDAGLPAARALAARLGGRPIELARGRKPLYHLAASLASGGVVAVLAAALDALVAAGFEEEEARGAIAPLVRASVESSLRDRPAGALTGPVARGDASTVESHRSAVESWDPGRRALYEALVAEQERLRGPLPGGG